MSKYFHINLSTFDKQSNVIVWIKFIHNYVTYLAAMGKGHIVYLSTLIANLGTNMACFFSHKCIKYM